MIGTICGDIIGSIYESWIYQAKVNDLNFNIFSSASIFTDDTTLTVAIADAILNNIKYEDSIYNWYNKYPNRGYGGGFVNWAHEFSKNKTFINQSNGNGAMMRVSPIGFAFPDLNTVLEEAKKSCLFTHNTEEAIKGAQSIAAAVHLAYTGKPKEYIKEYIETTFKYNLNYSLEDVRIKFDHRTTRCDVTGPQALIAYLNGTNVEDTIRKAIYTLGDCDTIAAIAGGIAFAEYKELPTNITEFVYSKLPQEINDLIFNFHSKYK